MTRKCNCRLRCKASFFSFCEANMRMLSSSSSFTNTRRSQWVRTQTNLSDSIGYSKEVTLMIEVQLFVKKAVLIVDNRVALWIALLVIGIPKVATHSQQSNTNESTNYSSSNSTTRKSVVILEAISINHSYNKHYQS